MSTFRCTGVLLGRVPSLNHLYANKRGGGRVLTTEGRKYKNETMKAMAQWLYGLPPINPNQPVFVHITHCLDNVLTKSWDKPGGAKSRFTRIDIDNMNKVLLDCFFSIVGVDDSIVCDLRCTKRQAPEGKLDCTFFRVSQTDDLDTLVSDPRVSEVETPKR